MKRKLVKIALGSVGVLVLIPVAWLVIEHFRGQWLLHRTLAELKAKGEKLTWQELMPPPVSVESNGLTLLTNVASRFPKARNQSPLSKFIAPGKRIPVVWLKSWTNYWDEKTNTWETVVKWREENSQNLEELRLALNKPAFDARLDYSQGFKLLLPHLQPIKDASQKVCLAALHEARAGNAREALNYLRAGCQFDMIPKDEPMLISQLVRVAMDTTVLDTFWQCLHIRDWTDAELREMQAVLLSPRGRMEGMAKSLEMERWMFRLAADEIRHGKFTFSQLIDLSLTADEAARAC